MARGPKQPLLLHTIDSSTEQGSITSSTVLQAIRYYLNRPFDQMNECIQYKIDYSSQGQPKGHTPADNHVARTSLKRFVCLRTAGQTVHFRVAPYCTQLDE